MLLSASRATWRRSRSSDLAASVSVPKASDASGVVQQTMLQAHQHRHQMRAQDLGQQAAWLRTILGNNIAKAWRDFHCAKRDIARERALEKRLQETSDSLEAWVAADESSPSQKAMRQERALRLAEVLGSLPQDQQEVLVLHHCQGWPISKVAEHMERTYDSVTGLLRRGLNKLREDLKRL